MIVQIRPETAGRRPQAAFEWALSNWVFGIAYLVLSIGLLLLSVLCRPFSFLSVSRAPLAATRPESPRRNRHVKPRLAHLKQPGVEGDHVPRLRMPLCGGNNQWKRCNGYKYPTAGSGRLHIHPKIELSPLSQPTDQLSHGPLQVVYASRRLSFFQCTAAFLSTAFENSQEAFCRRCPRI